MPQQAKVTEAGTFVIGNGDGMLFVDSAPNGVRLRFGVNGHTTNMIISKDEVLHLISHLAKLCHSRGDSEIIEVRELVQAVGTEDELQRELSHHVSAVCAELHHILVDPKEDLNVRLWAVVHDFASDVEIETRVDDSLKAYMLGLSSKLNGWPYYDENGVEVWRSNHWMELCYDHGPNVAGK